jgi:Ca2+-binding RTX toxin-like protein
VALAVNKIGTNGPDTLRGTNGDDNLLGGAGNGYLADATKDPEVQEDNVSADAATTWYMYSACQRPKTESYAGAASTGC